MKKDNYENKMISKKDFENKFNGVCPECGCTQFYTIYKGNKKNGLQCNKCKNIIKEAK